MVALLILIESIFIIEKIDLNHEQSAINIHHNMCLVDVIKFT